MSTKATPRASAHAHLEAIKPLHHSTYRSWAEACSVSRHVVQSYHLMTGVRPVGVAASARIEDFPGLFDLHESERLLGEAFDFELASDELCYQTGDLDRLCIEHASMEVQAELAQVSSELSYLSFMDAALGRSHL